MSLAGPIITQSTTRTTSTVTLDGGILNMNNNAIGGVTAITNVNLRSGTLSNVSQINNGAGLTKTTAGTLILAGTNAYTGTTTVSAGTLLVNGSVTGSAVNVNAGILGGTGSITNAVNIALGGTLAPGASIGTLSTGDVTLVTGAFFQLEINSSSLTTDKIASTGAIALGSATLNASDLGGALLTNFEEFIFLTGSSITGEYAGLADGASLSVGGNLFTIDYRTNDVALIAVPEPTAAVSFFGGLAALLGLQRFRRHRS